MKCSLEIGDREHLSHIFSPEIFFKGCGKDTPKIDLMYVNSFFQAINSVVLFLSIPLQLISTCYYKAEKGLTKYSSQQLLLQLYILTEKVLLPSSRV